VGRRYPLRRWRTRFRRGLRQFAGLGRKEQCLRRVRSQGSAWRGGCPGRAASRRTRFRMDRAGAAGLQPTRLLRS